MTPLKNTEVLLLGRNRNTNRKPFRKCYRWEMMREIFEMAFGNMSDRIAR